LIHNPAVNLALFVAVSRALGTTTDAIAGLLYLVTENETQYQSVAAKTAKQSAVLEERNRMAGEIHDSLAQSFAGISMQLAIVEEEMAANEGGLLSNVRRANEMAKFG
jgi:signal transduction histidine kinase